MRNWFNRLLTYVGAYLAREEIEGLRAYSFEAEERAWIASEQRDRLARELEAVDRLMS